MAKPVWLTDEAAKALQQFVQQSLLNNRQGSDNFGADGVPPKAADCFVAYPKDSTGIPGLTGDGTTGTGNTVVPGSALCDIYALQEGGLDPVGLEQTVYNLSDSALSQDWIVIHRTRHGSWVAGSTGNGGVLWGVCSATYSAYATIEVDVYEGLPGGTNQATGTTVDAIAPGLPFTYDGLGLIGDLVPIPSYRAIASGSPLYGFRPIECDASHSGDVTGTGT